VILVPAAHPPHKPAVEDPGAEHRLAMCRALLEGGDGLSVCAVELERGGTSYTVDTLRDIHASHPDAELTFIVGADTASTLPGWREPAEILRMADLAVAGRVGSEREQVRRTLASLAADTETAGSAGARARFLAMPAIDISSSLVRERVARGEPVVELVGPAVAAHIASHGLYLSGGRS